jgi:hypothetical protein
LLFAWLQEHVKLPLAASVKLTWTIDDIKEPPSVAVPKVEDEWVEKYLETMKGVCSVVILRNSSVEMHDTEEIAYLRAMLKLTEQFVRWGFYPMGTESYDKLVEACRAFIDSRDDTVSWKHDHDIRLSISDLTNDLQVSFFLFFFFIICLIFYLF